MRALPTALAAALLPALASAAIPVTFTRIADGANTAPDGSALFAFGTPQLSGGTVIFPAEAFSLLQGIYAAPATGGTLVSLVNTNTAVPHGTGNFKVVPSGCNAPVAGATAAAFVGMDSAGAKGVYSVPLKGGPVTRLADASTAIPGGPVPPSGYTTFNAQYTPCNVAISGSTVYFDTSGQGVYRVAISGRGLTRIADANTPTVATPPFPVVNSFFQPGVWGTNVVYIGGTTGGPYGVYATTTTTAVTPLVTDGNSEGSNFDQFSRPAIGGKTILFAADYAPTNNSSVLATVALTGGATKIVFNEATTPVPPGTTGDAFNQLGTDISNANYLANDGYRLLFTATTKDSPPKPFATYDGVFSICHGTLNRVVQAGDHIGTQIIRRLQGISALQRVIVGGVPKERFAIRLNLGAPTDPNGAPAIYVITIPAC